MNIDVAYQISLNTNGDDLKSLGIANKMFNKVYQSKQFWESKYHHDHLIHFGMVNKEIYKKVYKITKQTHNIFNLVIDHQSKLCITICVDGPIRFLSFLPFHIKAPDTHAIMKS